MYILSIYSNISVKCILTTKLLNILSVKYQTFEVFRNHLYHYHNDHETIVQLCPPSVDVPKYKSPAMNSEELLPSFPYHRKNVSAILIL